jgi:hypothetical protein
MGLGLVLAATALLVSAYTTHAAAPHWTFRHI